MIFKLNLSYRFENISHDGKFNMQVVGSLPSHSVVNYVLTLATFVSGE